MSFKVFALWMLAMPVVLAATHDYGPPLSPQALGMYLANVVLGYVAGGILWLVTRIFARTAASRMITIFAWGLFVVGIAAEILFAPFLQAAGIKTVKLREPLASLVAAPAPAPAVQTGRFAPVPPPVTRPAAAPPARSASTAPSPVPAAPARGCERREDTERNHVTITCR